jgi:hypothetical protein
MMDDETFRAWILEMYSAIWSAQREVLPARCASSRPILWEHENSTPAQGEEYESGSDRSSPEGEDWTDDEDYDRALQRPRDSEEGSSDEAEGDDFNGQQMLDPEAAEAQLQSLLAEADAEEAAQVCRPVALLFHAF